MTVGLIQRPKARTTISKGVEEKKLLEYEQANDVSSYDKLTCLQSAQNEKNGKSILYDHDCLCC